MVEVKALGYGFELYTWTCSHCLTKISALNEQTLRERVAKHKCKPKPSSNTFVFSTEIIAGERFYRAKCTRCNFTILDKKSRRVRSLARKHVCEVDNGHYNSG